MTEHEHLTDVARRLGDGPTAPETALAIPPRGPTPLPRDLIKEIAMDIGKEVAARLEMMYPDAVSTTSPNMLLHVRGSVVNEIMAALETIDEDAIRHRLDERKKFRRRLRAGYRKDREQDQEVATFDA